MAWHGAEGLGLARHGTVKYGMAWCGEVRCGTVGLGQAWRGQDGHSTEWLGEARLAAARPDMARQGKAGAVR
jgi:hypothetical protein